MKTIVLIAVLAAAAGCESAVGGRALNAVFGFVAVAVALVLWETVGKYLCWTTIGIVVAVVFAFLAVGDIVRGADVEYAWPGLVVSVGAVVWLVRRRQRAVGSAPESDGQDGTR